MLVLSVGAGPHPTIVAIGKRRKCSQTRKRIAHCSGPAVWHLDRLAVIQPWSARGNGESISFLT